MSVTIKENDLTAITEQFWFTDSPLVSCLMLTYNRFRPFKKAFECFIRQTYPNKELIIVNSGAKRYHKKVHKFVQKYMAVYDIKYTYCPIKNPTIGELRNCGLQYCQGEYVIGFDDDDIHHPMRITRQMDLCLKSNIQGTLLKNFTAKIGWKEYKCSILHGLEGTLLFKNPRGKVEYTEMNQGEDTDFISKLKNNGYNIAVIDESFDMYKYMYHRTNTVGKKHFKKMIELNAPVRN